MKRQYYYGLKLVLRLKNKKFTEFLKDLVTNKPMHEYLFKEWENKIICLRFQPTFLIFQNSPRFLQKTRKSI